MDFMTTASYGIFDIFLDTIEINLDINQQDEDGCTALMRATVFGHEQIVRKLLSMGAKTNIRNNDGVTALTIASKEGHKRITHFIVCHNAEVLDNRIQERRLMKALKPAHDQEDQKKKKEGWKMRLIESWTRKHQEALNDRKGQEKIELQRKELLPSHSERLANYEDVCENLASLARWLNQIQRKLLLLRLKE
jgi:hypothetical protein